MKRNLSEAVVRRVSVAWRWVGAVFAAVAMSVAVAPAFAADSKLSLSIVQDPGTAVNRGDPAPFKLVLTNNGPKTVNNILLYVNTGENAAATSSNPPCTLAPASSASCTVNTSPLSLPGQAPAFHPGFIFSITQLSDQGTATVNVSFV